MILRKSFVFFFWIYTSPVLASSLDCSPSGVDSSMVLSTSGHYNYTDVNEYMRGCIYQFANEYQNLENKDMPAKVRIRNYPRNLDVQVDSLSQGQWSQKGAGKDYETISRTRDFGDAAFLKCEKDGFFQKVRTPDPGDVNATLFLKYCNDIKKLDDIHISPTAFSTTSSEPTLSDPWAEQMRKTCNEKATYLSCAVKCRAGSSCSKWEHYLETGFLKSNEDLIRLAETCALDKNAKGCDNCLLNTPVRDFGSDPKAHCEKGLKTASVSPTESPSGEPGSSDPSSSPTGDAEEITNPSPRDAEQLNERAQQIAQDLWGGQPFQFDRGNASGSVNVPDTDVSSQLSASSNLRSGSGASPQGISASGRRSFNPLSRLPIAKNGMANKATTSQSPSASGGGGSRGGGGGLAGGGALGGRGATAGGRPSKKRRRRGRGSSPLSKVADNIGENKFLSADGGAKAAGDGFPEKRSLNPKYARKIRENKKQANTEDMIEGALSRGLSYSKQPSRSLMIQSSYFPVVTGFYFDLMEVSDHFETEDPNSF